MALCPSWNLQATPLLVQRAPPPAPPAGEAPAPPLSEEERQKEHEEDILETFNSVMLGDGLKVLKHSRKRSSRAASRIIRIVPEHGGALKWDRPNKAPGATSSCVAFEFISEMELEDKIVWICAGGERVGFETSQKEDATLFFDALSILVDRAHDN
ncbi:unnamed protein product [Discosporangium mesarthrocarpum]